MVTLKSNENHNLRLIKFCLEKAYPNGVTVNQLLEDNLICGTNLSELAVCKTNGTLEIHPVGIGQDLTDGSDVKTITVQEYRYLGTTGNKLIRHKAQIKDIITKIGTLRVIAYNPMFDKWIYFLIPNQYFSHLKKITISFNQQTGEPLGLYKQFQVHSWEELCKTEAQN